jgi:ribosome maturation factor RimP
MTVEERATTVVEDVVATLDAELYDVELAGGVLRVTLDHEGGVGLDELAVANRAISRALDEADPIPGRYTLEVTSPGLERTLRLPRHWQRAIGERIKVKTTVEIEGSRRVQGVLEGVDGDVATIRTEDGATRAFRLEDVDRARTVFEWGGQPKPSAGRTR